MSRKQSARSHADDTNPDEPKVLIPGFDPPTRSGKRARTQVPPIPPEHDLSPYDPLVTARGLARGANNLAMWPIMIGFIVVMMGGFIVRLLLVRLFLAVGLPSRAAEPVASIMALALATGSVYAMYRATTGRGSTPSRQVRRDDDEDLATSQKIYAVTLPWDARVAAGTGVTVAEEVIPIPASLEIVVFGGEPGVTLYYLDDRGDDITAQHYPSLRRAMGAAKAQFGIRRDEWEAV